MSCISPITIFEPKQGKYIAVPCGDCYECLKTKRRQWSFRLYQELKVSDTAFFITLTYAPEHIVYANDQETLNKRDLQLFFKKIRRTIDRVNKVSKNERETGKFRYFAVGEYGSRFDRPHYHGVFFNLPVVVKDKLASIWDKGFIHIGEVNPKSINYVTKYCITALAEQTTRENSFILSSRKPGIGYCYVPLYGDSHKKENRTFGIINGTKVYLPRYYNEKIFNKNQREKNAKKLQSAYDKLRSQHENTLIERGENPFYNDMERIAQSKEKLIKSVTKKDKL